MPENVGCRDCGLHLLGVAIPGREPRPIGRDARPRCGGTEFHRLDDTDRSGTG